MEYKGYQSITPCGECVFFKPQGKDRGQWLCLKENTGFETYKDSSELIIGDGRCDSWQEK